MALSVMAGLTSQGRDQAQALQLSRLGTVQGSSLAERQASASPVQGSGRFTKQARVQAEAQA